MIIFGLEITKAAPPEEKQARKELQEICKSLAPTQQNLLTGLDSAPAGLPDLVDPPRITLTEHGPYKPIKIEPEYINHRVLFSKLPIGTEFWAWGHEISPHTDGTAVFVSRGSGSAGGVDCYLVQQSHPDIIRFVKLPNAVACRDFEVREAIRGADAKDYSSSIQFGKALPVVCIEHATKFLMAQLSKDHAPALEGPDDAGEDS